MHQLVPLTSLLLLHPIRARITVRITVLALVRVAVRPIPPFPHHLPIHPANHPHPNPSPAERRALHRWDKLLLLAYEASSPLGHCLGCWCRVSLPSCGVLMSTGLVGAAPANPAQHSTRGLTAEQEASKGG